jgi:hypothetical protein
MFKIMKGDIQEDTQLRWDVKVLTPPKTKQWSDFQWKKVDKVKSYDNMVCLKKR